MSSEENIIEQDVSTSEEPFMADEELTDERAFCDSTPKENVILESHNQSSEESVSIPENCMDEDNIVKTDSVITDDQEVVEETNEIGSADKTISSKSRELKSILALSKEAKLDTNLPGKRKESTRKRDFAKLHTFGLTGKSPSSKSSHESKAYRFPVTAESELEEDSFHKPHTASMESPKPAKRTRTSSKESTSSNHTDDGIRKGRRIASGDIHILKPNKDMFCWRCHKDNVNIACETCPRSYHWKCLRQTVKNDKEHWPCPECVSILKAESTQTRSEAMKGMTLEHLCSLLKYALNRMIQCQGSEPFLHPVNDEEFPDYKKYIIQPMDLTRIEKNIKNNLYGSTQAFEADAKWILHNCIVFNSFQSKLTYTAKNIVRVCKQEMAEIELCPNCYLNANSKKNTWFIEVCPKPHILVWAKLKGFPYWPAKAMCTSQSGMVDVRFFGAHDRAWVHYKECYLYSEKDPNTFKQKRYDIEKCIEEVDVYIENLRKVYGEFRHAPYKTFLDPDNELKQLQIFLPKYKHQKAIKFKKKLHESKSEYKSDSSDDDEPKQSTSKKENENKSDIKNEESEINSKEDDEEEKISEKKESKNEPNESFSSPSSPVNDTSRRDNDTLEEGYGTDDSNADDDIDLERRKAFVDPDHNTTLGEETIEDEDDSDTQVPNNISVDNLLRGKVRMRGGLNVTPGKIRILPRRKSEILDNLKRHSTENSDELHQKLPRRNSDQSSKSDSSRVSNISDKINRVDTFEKMEVTVGNDDVARVSISEQVCASSISGNDDNVEIKRKPVQVDIDNAEFTISPSSKLKIADKLIKRLSDPTPADTFKNRDKVVRNIDMESPQNTDDPINGRSSTSPNKSQTDILIEKHKTTVAHRAMNFNDSETSEVSTINHERKDDQSNGTEDEDGVTTGKANSEKTSEIIKTKNVSNKKSPSDKIMDENHVDPSENVNDNKKIEDPSYRKELLNKQKNLIQPSITEFTTNSKKTEGILERKKTEECKDDSDNSDAGDEEVKTANFDKKRIYTIIHSSLNEETNANKSPEEEIIRNVDDKMNNKKHNSKDNAEEDHELKTTEASKKNDDKTEEQQKSNLTPEETKSTKIIKIKIAEVKPPSTRNSKCYVVKPTRSISPPKKSVEYIKERHIDSGIIPVKASLTQSGNSNKEFRSYSNLKNKHKMAISNGEAAKTTSSTDSSEKMINSEAKNEELTPMKKRKLSTDGSPSAPASKLVKLVPIESILNKGFKDKSVTATLPESGVTELNNSEAILAETIKSEPESDDDFQESENLEAKKRYLSALNISEKNLIEAQNNSKDNEIRTRSRAEEKRERFKIVDNLTRVIDDVALNYSANHPGHEMQISIVEKKKVTNISSNNWPEGEITVKSFAKLPSSTPSQQRARKSFPTPSSSKTTFKQSPATAKKDGGTFVNNEHSVSLHTVRKEVSLVSTSANYTTTITNNASITTSFKPISSLASSTVLTNTLTAVINPSVTATSTPSNTMSHVILLPTSSMNYGSPIINSVLGMVPSPLQPQLPIISAVATANPVALQSMHLKTNKTPYISPNINASQNYIPQSENRMMSATTPSNNIILNNLLNQQDVNSLVASASNPSTASSGSEQQTAGHLDSQSGATGPIAIRERPTEEDLTLLNSIVPENVTRAVNELMVRPPPRLKPRPPGMLSTVFDDGVPSSAGEITTRINSVAHRMNDYLRGMLIETLEDLGRNSNPEAKIVSLQLEIEALKHKHNVEMQEVKKNMGTLLKDIQRSVEENKERILAEARSAWETETIKRVELAKSKQWCANCSKEAKFYCCWNTSYCDYPCQQKHWPQHMGKCTQHIEKSTGSSSSVPNHNQSVLLRQTTAGAAKSATASRMVGKPTKVYMNNKTAAVPPKTYKALSSTGNHITVIEKTPGNYEVLGNGSVVGGKVYQAGSSVLNSKFKSANIMSVTSPSSSNPTLSKPSNSSSSSSESMRSPVAGHSKTSAASTATHYIDDDEND